MRLQSIDVRHSLTGMEGLIVDIYSALEALRDALYKCTTTTTTTT